MKLPIAALFALVASVAEAQEVSYQNLLKRLLDANKTITGEPLVYPSGDARVNVSIVTLPPGGQTGWHVHPVPLVAYILEGELTVDYGTAGKRTYKKGDALLEAMGMSHNGVNTGAVAVQILAVYLGADGKANAAPGAVPRP